MYGDDSFLSLITGMYVWQAVALIVTEIHQHQDTVEHTDGRHDNRLYHITLIPPSHPLPNTPHNAITAPAAR